MISIGTNGGRNVAKMPLRLRVLVQRAHPRTGHLRVDLRAAGQKYTYGVHQIVARTWHGTDGDLVRHLDGDPANNAAGNLKHGTHRENAFDRVGHEHERAGQTAAEFAAANPDVPF